MIKDGPVGEIRLNEPEVLNAQGRRWPEDMLAAEEVRDASSDEEVGEEETFVRGEHEQWPR